MKNFGDHHPKTRKQLQLAAKETYTTVIQRANQLAQTNPEKSIFPVMADLEVWSKNDGHVVLPVKVIDRGVLCTSGQIILKANSLRIAPPDRNNVFRSAEAVA